MNPKMVEVLGNLALKVLEQPPRGGMVGSSNSQCSHHQIGIPAFHPSSILPASIRRSTRAASTPHPASVGTAARGRSANPPCPGGFRVTELWG
jgi:hypothetical protein